MPQNSFDDKLVFGSGKGSVPSGNKPLPEPKLTQVYAAKWCN